MAVALARFLLRPYFSRIWVVQEVALGDDKSIAIRGARRFSWANILRCGKMLNAGRAATTWNYDMKLDQTQDEEGDYLTFAHLADGITKLQMLRDTNIDCRRQQEEDEKGDGRVPGANTLWFLCLCC